MEKRSLLFKEDIEFKGKVYKAGFAYELELEVFEFNRLTRRGCVYADKNAKYYQEQKPVEQKPDKVRRGRKPKKVIEDVDYKDIQSPKIQTNDTDKD